MADIQRQGSAHWTGDLLRGSGTTSTGSGVLKEVPYSVPSRFENSKGTNPEELIAAAHASCFSMMLSKLLGDAKKTASDIRTKATLTLSNASGGWKISKIHLETEVSGGGLLGWSWLFPPYIWHFDARAVEPTTAIFFYGTILREYCDKDPALGLELFKRMSEVMTRRLQRARIHLIEEMRKTRAK